MKTNYSVNKSIKCSNEDKYEMEFIETIYGIRIKEKDDSEMSVVNSVMNPILEFHEHSFYNRHNAVNFCMENPNIEGKVVELDVYNHLGTIHFVEQ